MTMINELSIIIPAYNEERYLPLLLESIVDQHFNGTLQVIVVNGQSEDKTVEVAKRFQGRIADLQILTTKRGIGYQRNRGVEKAKYPYLLFLDADMILSKNLLNKLAQKIKDKNTIATVTFWPTGKNVFDYFVIFIMYPAFLFLIYARDVSTPGGFIVTSKQLHKKIKGFREDIILGEDVDYGRRCFAVGAKFRMFLSLSIFHSPRRARDLGRLGLLWYWWKSHLYVEKHGPIYKDGRIKYPYGHYGKSIEERKKLY